MEEENGGIAKMDSKEGGKKSVKTSPKASASKPPPKKRKSDITARASSQGEEFWLAVQRETREEVDTAAFFKFLKRHRIRSKLVYILTVSSIVFLSYATLGAQQFIPYVYSIVTPILLAIRLVLYWRLKYQYFLLDFCYFANAFIYVYIWALPQNETMFLVAYATATGPLLWSMLVFRNSLVFHSLDKVTSMYIHSLPPILLYVIRWYPKETSQLWYTEFPAYDRNFSVKWLTVIPFAFPVLHQIFYGILVYVIMKPSDEYLYTYNYLVSKEETTISYRISHFFGPRFQHVVFASTWLLVILGMLSLNLVWFNYFVGNCVALIALHLVAVYNGATFYMDVFSVGAKSWKNTEADSSATDDDNCDSCKVNSKDFKAYDAVVTISTTKTNGYETSIV